VIGVRWRRPKVAGGFGSAACHARVAILSAFGVDALGAVLVAGAAAFRHHRDAVGIARPGGDGFDFSGGCAQGGEQQRAAGCGDIGTPGR
jgi:hypothetical protein